MKISKYIAVFISGLMCSAALSGQDGQSAHELSVYLGGGLSTLNYDTRVGKQTDGNGGLGGFGYSYFFSEKWGIVTGAEVSLYKARMTFDYLSDKYVTKDVDGENFEFRSKVSNYKEKHHSIFLNIPVMMQYQTPGDKHRFYAMAGGKIGIPLRTKYKTSGATIENSGYYMFDDVEYTTQKFMGFGVFTDKNMNEKVDFKISFTLSAEVGTKWRLGDNLSLYSGLFIDYGVNDIGKGKRNQRFIAYNSENPRNFTSSSILVSQFAAEDGKTVSFIDKVNVMTAGIKLRFSFGIGQTKK
ncbi:hypothetical protein D0T53_01035 [Dysgonomonas sp. 216]|uniref:outer membrane beta-barrel protein n=1 Tax=Dysgonomonas sp. 216 TaxID=2302934 RepID=UPI0013D6CDF9|nr:outer membrane beta-barrel protein [Dysgonomonas sp. 216]NDW17497.1 hypothetical protein [Dysgonomonas sp. 216]